MAELNINMEQSGKAKADIFLAPLVLLLTGVGLVTLYSSSYAFAEKFFSSGIHFISQQLVFAAVGIVAFFLASRISLDALRKMIIPIVFGTLFLCLLTFVPGIGVEKNGAARWIRIGSTSRTFQPSELVKLVLPFYLAHIFGKKEKDEELGTFASGMLPPAIIVVLFFAVIYAQNNFSTALFVLLNALVVFCMAGLKWRYFAGIAVVMLPLSAFFVLTKEHRLRRLITFLDPQWDPQGASYQVRLSRLSIEAGGFWGKGIGQGTRKIASVPEVQSDFIFASFAEEAGFIGVVLIFILFCAFGFVAYRSVLRTKDTFRRLLSFGLTTTILSQAFLNMAVVAGAVPATGVPLPFFSSGGSSLAVTLVMCGILVNNSRREAADA